MKKITSLHTSKKIAIQLCGMALLSLPSSSAWSQTTVFSDDFNRTGTVVSPGPGGVVYTTLALDNTKTPTSGGLDSKAEITDMMPNGGTGGSPAIGPLPSKCLNLLQGGQLDNGSVQTSAPLSSFSAPFNTTLSSNTGIITWTVNMRTNRGTATANGLSGFSIDGAGTNYGMAVVLAGSNSNLMLGTGYVLTFQQASSTLSNVVSLRRYDNGVNTATTGSSMTTFIAIPTTSAIALRYNFISVKVTYNPTTNEWSLFLRDDGSGAWGAPTTTITQVGATTVDATYTATAMTHFGFFFKHGVSTPALNQAFFDNFKVVVGPNVLSNEEFDLAGLEMYPNPANNEFTVSYKSAISNIAITNLLGQIVKEFKMSSNTTTATLAIDDLPPATYLVKVTSEGNSKVTKFIKS
jgi:hypothetical protein